MRTRELWEKALAYRAEAEKYALWSGAAANELDAEAFYRLSELYSSMAEDAAEEYRRERKRLKA
jgi:hypothetical protein